MLKWTPGENRIHVSQVIVRREVKRGAQVEDITTYVDLTMRTFTDDIVESGTRYIYRVKAMKSNSHYFISGPAHVTVE